MNKTINKIVSVSVWEGTIIRPTPLVWMS